jgi:hypothetical protein
MLSISIQTDVRIFIRPRRKTPSFSHGEMRRAPYLGQGWGDGKETLEKSNALRYTVCIENRFHRRMLSQGGNRMADVLFKRAYK